MSRRQLRPRIGLVVPAFDKGGLEQVVLNLYRGYRRRGYSCVILVEGNSAGYMAQRTDNPDDVFVFNGNETEFLRICLKLEIETLHYHYSSFCLSAMKHLGFYAIYTIHNVYTWMTDEEFRARAVELANADRVIAVSSFVRDYFLARSGDPALRVDVIPNGIDTSELTLQTRFSRAELGAPPDGCLFINLASTNRAKHQPALIGAAEILLKTRTDFFIAMMGNAADPQYREETEEILAKSPARDHVAFRPFVSVDKLYSLYTEVADCLVMPSLQEGSANVVLEALATGCPMILTDVGAARESAAIDENIIIVPCAYPNLAKLRVEEFVELSRVKNPPNVEAIAAAMNRMIDSRPPRLDSTELESRCNAVSAQQMVDAYVSVIETETGRRHAYENDAHVFFDIRSN